MCVASANTLPFCLLQQPCPGDTGPVHCQEVSVGKGREALVLIGVECVESGCRGGGVAVLEQRELCRVGSFCLEASQPHPLPLIAAELKTVSAEAPPRGQAPPRGPSISVEISLVMILYLGHFKLKKKKKKT